MSLALADSGPARPPALPRGAVVVLLALALGLHLALGALVFWNSMRDGTEAEGQGGLTVGLGPAGAPPGAQDAVAPSSAETAPPEAQPPVAAAAMRPRATQRRHPRPRPPPGAPGGRCADGRARRPPFPRQRRRPGPRPTPRRSPSARRARGSPRAWRRWWRDRPRSSRPARRTRPWSSRPPRRRRPHGTCPRTAPSPQGTRPGRPPRIRLRIRQSPPRRPLRSGPKPWRPRPRLRRTPPPIPWSRRPPMTGSACRAARPSGRRPSRRRGARRRRPQPRRGKRPRTRAGNAGPRAPKRHPNGRAEPHHHLRPARAGRVVTRQHPRQRRRHTGGGSPGARADFAARVAARLARAKQYPRAAQQRRLEGTGVIWFRMNAAGAVTASRLTRGTGHSMLDQAIAATLRRARLPAIPDSLGQTSMEFSVPISFSLR